MSFHLGDKSPRIPTQLLKNIFVVDPSKQFVAKKTLIIFMGKRI